MIRNQILRLRIVLRKSAMTRWCAIATFAMLGLCAEKRTLQSAAPVADTAGSGVVRRTAPQLVRRLLRDPARLQLIGSADSKRTFFFGIEARQTQQKVHYSLLVASSAGKVAIVIYNAHGRAYGYFANGLLVLVDTKRPGYLDVFRGVSPVLVVGGRAGAAHQRGAFAFEIAPVAGTAAGVALDLSGPLQSTLVRATQSRFQPISGTATFYGKHGSLTFRIAGPKASFPIKSISLVTPNVGLLVSNITVGADPLDDVFNITLAKLKASGVPLRIQKYQKGEVLPLFPTAPGFKSNIPEIQAAGALEQLMPVNGDRVRAINEHWMSQQISDLRKSAPADLNLQQVAAGKPDMKSGLLPMIRIFQMVEFGTHNALDTEAWHTISRDGHPFYSYYSWKFDRRAYRKLLKQTWGSKQVENLTSTLVGIALNKDRGPTQKLAAVDLLADIGPGKADSGWAKDSTFISKVYANYSGAHDTAALLLGLIRARWGLPVGAAQITVAKKMLANPKTNITLRVRAMEILSFTGHLPDDRHLIGKIVKAYLDKPVACIASPVPGRYIYDLSLCKTGRKILLEELADRHSRLYGEQLLPQAAFNDARPGQPGYKLAIRTALRLVDNPKYSPAVRHEAFVALCFAAKPVYRRFVEARIGSNVTHFGWDMQIALTERKAVADFIPQLTSLFERGDTDDKVRILLTVGFGFPKGGKANVAAAIIRRGLENASAKVRWAAVGCIGNLKFAGANLDVSPFRPILLSIVKNDFKGHLGKAVDALNCFSRATDGRWRMPVAGMTPRGEWPNLKGEGLAWWQKHYAAARASALKWAADHPHYPTTLSK